MRPRFSLRVLLAVTALAAAFCYWWVAWPTVVATRFVEAENSGDYVAADRMIHRGQDDFVADWVEFAESRTTLEDFFHQRIAADAA